MKYFHIFIIATIITLYASCFNIESVKQIFGSIEESHHTTAFNSSSKILWPLPKSISINQSAQNIEFNLQDIAFKVEALSDNVQNLIDYYLINVIKIPQNTPQKGSQIILNIVVKNTKQIYAELPLHQRYQITIRQSLQWQLIADYYPGFVRGFDTLIQLMQKQGNGKYIIKGRPVLIDDQPDYVWRGLMIDTARHYLPVGQIKKIMDGMMYNKMNVFHWHIVDQDTFPLQVPAMPELHKYGAGSGTYSPEAIKQILQYAALRSIRVIPEYDTPAHTRSWGRSPSLTNITIQGQNGYQGQFDPTINLTYQVVNNVMKYITSSFPDKYQHLGGDEVDFDVWDTRPSIKQWMSTNNISNYDDLQIYYRIKQRQMLRKTNSTKKAIYWANQQINLPVEDTDIIQWWGQTKNIQQIKIHKNEIILSQYDIAYLDVGFGDQLGDPYRTQISWRQMYKFNPRIEGVRVIGGQACMWAQTVTKQNIEQKLWIRSSVIAQRLWNVGIDGQENILNIVYRLVEQKKRMQFRGYKVSPVTVGLCEKNPDICFS